MEQSRVEDMSWEEIVNNKFNEMFDGVNDKQKLHMLRVIGVYLDKELSRELTLSGDFIDSPWIPNMFVLKEYMGMAACAEEKTTFDETMVMGAIWLEQCPEGIQLNKKYSRFKDSKELVSAVAKYYQSHKVDGLPKLKNYVFDEEKLS